MTTGQYLKRCRKEIGYTQEDVSKQIGLSRASYTNIECDRQKISVDNLINLSHILGFPLDDFIEKVYNIKILTTSVKEAKIRRLEKQRESINRQIKELKDTE